MYGHVAVISKIGYKRVYVSEGPMCHSPVDDKPGPILDPSTDA